jgi:hypothetical protein
VGAKRTREYLYETFTQPQAVIIQQYEQVGPAKPFPAQMPVINKPPVGLSEPELLAVIAFVQSLGGKVTVQPEEVKAAIIGASVAPSTGQARWSLPLSLAPARWVDPHGQSQRGSTPATVAEAIPHGD